MSVFIKANEQLLMNYIYPEIHPHNCVSSVLRMLQFVSPEAADELSKIAIKRDQTISQMALAWVLRDQRVTSALIGASTASQIVENVKAVQQVEFTVDELGKLNRILAKANLPNSLWAN